MKVTLLRVPAAERGDLAAQVPEDGIALDVDVTSTLGPCGRGRRRGIASVTSSSAPRPSSAASHASPLTFAAHGSEALVRLRYVPSAPWFEPLGEPSVRVPIRGPGLAAKAPILLAGLAVLAFFLVGRVGVEGQQARARAGQGRRRIDRLEPSSRGRTRRRTRRGRLERPHRRCTRRNGGRRRARLGRSGHVRGAQRPRERRCRRGRRVRAAGNRRARR